MKFRKETKVAEKGPEDFTTDGTHNFSYGVPIWGRSDVKKAVVYFSEAERSKFFYNAAKLLYREMRVIGCIAAGIFLKG